MFSPIFFTQKTEEGNFGKFVIEPLPQGFGQSMGHALRRTLLSSLKGAAVTNIKFDGAPHLFSTIPGVKESVLEIRSEEHTSELQSQSNLVCRLLLLKI